MLEAIALRGSSPQQRSITIMEKRNKQVTFTYQGKSMSQGGNSENGVYGDQEKSRVQHTQLCSY